MGYSEKDLLEHLKEISLLNETIGLAHWDMTTGMPDKANEQRGEMIAYLSGLSYELNFGEKMTDLMTYFEDRTNELSVLAQQAYEVAKKEFDLNHKIDKESYLGFQKALTQAHGDWVTSRESKDFNDFKASLSELIQYTKQFIPLWKKDEVTPYDVLLNQYEPGMTVEKLDEVFKTLRTGIMEIREKIASEGVVPRTDFLYRHVSKEQQRQFVEKVIADLGYDLSRGRLDDTIHPYELTLNQNDVRITTRWAEEDFQMAVLGTIHEAGHGLYEQNINSEFAYTPLASGASMGIHESQSLFNELVVAGSENFWKRQYPVLQDITGETFEDIDFETFYRGLKQSQASLIRIEADSLTYPLHIIIRYEIEKMIFNEEVAVEDLPTIWNDKYEEYLGIRPENDLEGILQDSHWSGGSFGYFPSYALGYMYAAQLEHAMNKEIDIQTTLASDDYSAIIEWNKHHIHQYGASKKPNWLIKQATGEDLNPNYLLTFLKNMYYSAYQIEA
ncbi:carboxypeptidase M32 [Vagococcus xieshaowenii]|uniref:Metal-dependent carboxypeptidase n=1 Tax=Vagococcus xieshaowenii TaxID=2562451 RepID=A0AAJ5EDX2_9ENTE|nr:carboxypeptidase M32 [Vagococcus xieshaowenii]QCA28577.1 carboxypeptidase M32 [Vagococcus xieshaowenii]TFZ40615.1 carboxypeptidase M32 [Vagococcus xieshaowenii]